MISKNATVIVTLTLTVNVLAISAEIFSHVNNIFTVSPVCYASIGSCNRLGGFSESMHGDSWTRAQISLPLPLVMFDTFVVPSV